MAITKPLRLDDLFDPAQGWQYPADQVPVHPLQGPDDNPYYLVRVDRFDVLVFEQTEEPGHGRLCRHRGITALRRRPHQPRRP